LLFSHILIREFDQKRLELLEHKDQKIKELKEKIEQELVKIDEDENKRLLREKDAMIQYAMKFIILFKIYHLV
jgi:hypothetical protein